MEPVPKSVAFCLFTVHMCSLHILLCPHLCVTSERWQMADWPDTDWGKPPFFFFWRVTPGRGSDVTTTSAGGSSRRPGPVMHPISVADLLPRATVAAIEDETGREVSAQEENNEGYWGRDDGEDNKSIGLTAEIIPLLCCSYTTPHTHLIFAQLLICAPLFMSSLFTFPPAQFTCCCWDYPARQACRFLLLKQLLCSVCFEHNQDSIKESLNIFCLTPSFFFSFFFFKSLELVLRQLSPGACESHFCAERVFDVLLPS